MAKNKELKNNLFFQIQKGMRDSKQFNCLNNVEEFVSPMMDLILSTSRTQRRMFLNQILLILATNRLPEGVLEYSNRWMVERNEDQLKVLRLAFAYCVACGDIDLPFGGTKIEDSGDFANIVSLLISQK